MSNNERIDHLLEKLTGVPSLWFLDYCQSMWGASREERIVRQRLRDRMYAEGLIYFPNQADHLVVAVTPHGVAIVESGGYLAYQASLRGKELDEVLKEKAKEQRDEEMAVLSRENARLTIENNRFNKKTQILQVAVAFLSILLAAYAAGLFQDLGAKILHYLRFSLQMDEK